ncbi:MAG: hypothetical protein U1A72_10665 [Sulfuritalea sp.]|nr:hypothetical protein [Sulfuritalea sp.]
MRFDGSKDKHFRNKLIDRVSNDLRRLSNCSPIDRYGIAIVGSWATKEPHLIIRTQGTTVSYASYSDLDLVHEESLAQSERDELLEQFEQIANIAGIRKVSLRSIDDYKLIPHGATWICTAPIRSDPNHSAFLAFWFLVSCTEAIALERREGRCIATLHYSLAKSLYALLRNVAFIRGDFPKSYMQINRVFSGPLGLPLLAAAYHIKLGIGCAGDPVLKQFFQQDIAKFLRSLPYSISGEAAALISEYALDFSNGTLCVNLVLDAMATTACSESMRGVVAYQTAKLKK